MTGVKQKPELHVCIAFISICLKRCCYDYSHMLITSITIITTTINYCY